MRAVYDTGEGTGTEPTTHPLRGRRRRRRPGVPRPAPAPAGDKVFCVERHDRRPARPGHVRLRPRPSPPTTSSSTTAGRIDIDRTSASRWSRATSDEDEKLDLGHPRCSPATVPSDIPTRLRGTLHVPTTGGRGGDTAVDFDAAPPIGEVQATVQNFVGRRPAAGRRRRPQRAGLPPSIGPNYDTVTLLQQGDLLRAAAFITQPRPRRLRELRHRRTDPELDAGRGPLEVAPTSSTSASAHRPRVRAYVDTDDGDKRAIADVTVARSPRRPVAVLPRRARRPPTTSPCVEPTTAFCDTGTATDGAFELSSTPHEAGEELDVNAYFRIADADRQDLSGRADIEDLPPRSCGPSSAATAEALSVPDGETTGRGDAASVGRLGFHVASFDIADHGYSDPPFVPAPAGRPVPGAAAAGGQHIGAA